MLDWVESPETLLIYLYMFLHSSKHSLISRIEKRGYRLTEPAHKNQLKFQICHPGLARASFLDFLV